MDIYEEVTIRPSDVGDIMNESVRQIAKWGVQTRSMAEWMLFLTEEVGELAEAIAEHEYREGDSEEIFKEAIQVSTLALKIAKIAEVRMNDN